MSWFSARKTTCHCRMISAACWAMHTQTLPLRGDMQPWPQGKKINNYRDTLGSQCVYAILTSWLAYQKEGLIFLFGRNVRILISDKQCKSGAAPLISMLIFAADITDVRFLTPAPFPVNCHVKIKNHSGSHCAFPDAAGHSHSWNTRNPIVTRGRLTRCRPP